MVIVPSNKYLPFSPIRGVTKSAMGVGLTIITVGQEFVMENQTVNYTLEES